MTPFNFPESNARTRAPNGMDESQLVTIPAYIGKIRGGNLDGSEIIIVAWKPSEQELKDLNEGKLIYLHVMGDLPPHCLTTEVSFV